MSTELAQDDSAALTIGWRPIVMTITSIAGLGASVYLTIVHYSTGLTLACPQTKTFNCEKVTTSAESKVFGIPVAVLGLAFFIGMLALSLPWAWRTTSRLVAPLRLGSVVIGIGFVFYLLHAELFDIHAICLWCSSVHLLTFVLFVIVVTGWDDATAAWLVPIDDGEAS